MRYLGKSICFGTVYESNEIFLLLERLRIFDPSNSTVHFKGLTGKDLENAQNPYHTPFSIEVKIISYKDKGKCRQSFCLHFSRVPWGKKCVGPRKMFQYVRLKRKRNYDVC